MNHATTRLSVTVLVAVFVLTIGASLTLPPPAMGHGGKTHGENEFTAFKALQKGTQLYDRLIVSGKLAEDWEIELRNVVIETRQSGNQHEFVIRFEKTKGDPKTVYFFFDQKGKYTGSNFTGE